MSDFWKGFVLGVVASLIAAYLWHLMARFRAHRAARKLVGTWVAYNIHGRTIDTTPMPGAGLTVVSSNRHWWAADSGLLDVHAQDIDPSTGQTREHDGSIVLDTAKPWLAIRILRYADSDEVAQQRLEIDLKDWSTVRVFPDPTVATLGNVYPNHAWRRAP
jgi:hypothetical protein